MRGQRGLDTGSWLKLHLNRDFFRLEGLQLGEISKLIKVLNTLKNTFKKIKNSSRPAKCGVCWLCVVNTKRSFKHPDKTMGI